VWHDTPPYGPTGSDYTPAMVGSDIANLEAGNIKDGVQIDNVKGSYDPMSGAKWPGESNVLDVETVWGPTGAEYAGKLSSDNVLVAGGGNYVVTDHDDVRLDVEFGASKADKGKLDLPATTDVKLDVEYDQKASKGTYDPVTGNYTDPGKANVKSGEKYTFASIEITGELKVSGGGGGSYGLDLSIGI
jgi:hypothetical protein